jgi:hypothetical protein
MATHAAHFQADCKSESLIVNKKDGNHPVLNAGAQLFGQYGGVVCD